MELKQNFTTPAQSSTLLAIGVPAASADCYFYDWAWNGGEHYGSAIQVCHESDFLKEREIHREYMIYPCWSAGQLLYILKECIERDDDKEVIFMDLTYKQGSIIDLLMSIIEDRPVINFSKLNK